MGRSKFRGATSNLNKYKDCLGTSDVDFDSVGLSGVRDCTYNKLPDDAEAAGPMALFGIEGFKAGILKTAVP